MTTKPTTMTNALPVEPVDVRRVGITCPSGFCGFVAVTPTVTAGGKPAEGRCPKCARVIRLT